MRHCKMNRLASFLMALCMVLTMLPIEAMATEIAPEDPTIPGEGETLPQSYELTADNVTLNEEFFTPTKGGYKIAYNGNHINANPKVRDAQGNVLTEDVDYTVDFSHSTRRNVGKYMITVTGMGNYTGVVEVSLIITPKAPQVSVRLSTSSGGYDDAYVTWNKVPGASGYAVYYRRPTRSSTWTSLKRTTGTSLLKKDLYDGYKYEFKVVPYVTIDTTRYYSTDYDIAYTYTLKKMSSPSLSRYNSSRVRVSWTNISGESGYQVSRSTSSSGTNIVYTTSGTAVNLTTTGEKTYYYKVRAYKNVTKDGETYRVYGPWSSARSYALKALEAPEMRNYNYVGRDYIKLTWSRNSHASGYWVYRKANDSNSWERIAKISGNSHVTYTDKTARSGYDYSVRAYGYKNGDLIYSNRSNTVHCHTLRPVTINVTAMDTEMRNVITWNHVSYATGYHVYRRLGEHGDWVRIAKLGKVDSYTTGEVNHGQRYFYKVRPVYTYHGNISYGPYSNVDNMMHYYKPELSFYMSNETYTDTGVVIVSITNNGVGNVRIYNDNARMEDKDFADYDRSLQLMHYDPDDVYNTYPVDYVDVAPGESTMLVFFVNGPDTWYDRYTTVYFNFRYDGVQYRAAVSNYYGGGYYER